jgi:small-conductance mechanosensitive channel
MKRFPFLISLVLLCIALVASLEICVTTVSAQTESVDPTTEATLPPPTVGAGENTSIPDDSRPEVTPEPTLTPTPANIVSSAGDEIESIASQELFTFEGPVTRWIADLSVEYGWDQVNFLGLSVEDWINLALSVVFFLLIYHFGKRFINRGLHIVLRRTKLENIDAFLDAIRSPIDWLVLTIGLQFSLARLSFLSSGLRVLLNQVFFVAYLTIISILLWRVITFATDTFLHRNRTEEDIQRLSPIFMVVKRVSQSLVIILYISIFLSYFGIDITAFAAALGIGGLAISLAAQDTLADAIAGFLILIDQPFRVGDRIEIAGLGTWGDVVDIGTRSTRIRTRDNRLVIVPNSAIAKDQIVNYTYPDPRYRVQIEVGIDYDSDLKRARQAAIEAVRHVDGVLLDKPIDALFVDFGESAITFRIRWWIDSYVDTRRMFDKVNEALLEGFNEAGINLPNMTYDLNLKVDEGDVRQFTEKTRPDKDELPRDE